MLCLLIASVDAPEEKRKIEQLYEKYNQLMYSSWLRGSIIKLLK